jgi:hypothetical protein
MTNTQKIWTRDFGHVAKALEDGGHVASLQDGDETFQYLLPSTPPQLARLHRELASIGYANGWL